MILITGGTGQSGSEIVRQLAAAGAAFRMLVRDPVKAAGIAPKGVELVKGSFDDVASMEAAAKGCDTALFNSEGSAKLPAQQQNFLSAMKSAGMRRIVRFSAVHADPNSSMNFLRWHGEAESALKASGLDWTIFRPSFFMQEILGTTATVKSQGMMYMPAGDGKAPYIDLADIAAVAVKILTTGGHGGKIYSLTGPADLSWNDIAAAVSRAVGATVQYVNVPPEAAKQSLMGLGLEEWRADAILQLMQGLRSGKMAGVTGDVQVVTGKPAKSVGKWAVENAAAFM